MDSESKEMIINELVYELSECREDERNSKNQMLQIVSTAGAIIGSCFGVSALFPNITEQQEAIDLVNHIVLILNSCILCTAFPYITFLGIGDVLRFHYIRSLEDQLTQLISDNTARQNMLLHWMSMSAPILTKNPRNILKTRYTLLAYLCYAMSAIAAVAFGILTILIEFFNITRHNCLDYIAFYVTFIFIGLSLVSFF